MSTNYPIDRSVAVYYTNQNWFGDVSRVIKGVAGVDISVRGVVGKKRLGDVIKSGDAVVIVHNSALGGIPSATVELRRIVLQKGVPVIVVFNQSISNEWRGLLSTLNGTEGSAGASHVLHLTPHALGKALRKVLST